MGALFERDHFDTTELIAALAKNGYIVNSRDFEFTKNNNLIKYKHYSHGRRSFVYEVALRDHNETNIIVTRVYVYLGDDGDLHADYAGCPDLETEDEDKVLGMFA